MPSRKDSQNARVVDRRASRTCLPGAVIANRCQISEFEWRKKAATGKVPVAEGRVSHSLDVIRNLPG